jgi:pyridoxal phosphate enzyme (YggS family)
MRDMFVPDPARKVEARVQEGFPELGKIKPNLVSLRSTDDMAPENSLPIRPHSPNGLASVEQEIARACKQARRERASVTLIAVSKTFGAEAITSVIEAGQHVFGENRVQEAKTKWPGLMSAYPGIVLHLIGPLQSNKAKEAVALFDAIHSVDRASICQALAKEIDSQKKRPQLFVQLNTGEEPQKAGVAPGQADAFIASCREKYGLQISGLMCIPPVNDAPAPHFALTAKIAARNGLKNLSMGMSADFATAIQLGATHVRIGSAIFGHR